LQKLLHRADVLQAIQAVQDAIKHNRDYALEYRVNRADGLQAWVSARGRPMYHDDGSPSGMVGVVQDISERKRHEQHLRLLINELNHRVKNTLAMVQSIAGQTLRYSRDPEDARARFDERLVALAAAHDTLTKENWESAVLSEIVENTIAPHGSALRFSIEGPQIRVAPKAALTLAMALHELCTNAVKYGALSNPKGKVSIVWAVAGKKGARELRLRWQEEDGPLVSRPGRRGFGSRLIEQSLGQDLNGEVQIDYAPQGVICTIRAPLEQKTDMLELS
jgi:two-component sensor histidine kinase